MQGQLNCVSIEKTRRILARPEQLSWEMTMTTILRKFQLITLLLMCVSAGLQSPSNARPLERHFGSDDSCYGRAYGADHLKKNRNQRVEEMSLHHHPRTFGLDDGSGKISFDSKTAELFFQLKVKFRDSDQIYSDSGSCSPDGNRYRCFIECDGGGFYLKDRSSDSILLINERGFSVSGCGSEDYREVTPKTQDKVFRLYRLPAAVCLSPVGSGN